MKMAAERARNWICETDQYAFECVSCDRWAAVCGEVIDEKKLRVCKCGNELKPLDSFEVFHMTYGRAGQAFVLRKKLRPT